MGQTPGSRLQRGTGPSLQAPTPRSAPPSLAACLAHEAVSQLLRSDLSEFRKLPEQEEDGDRAEEKAPVIREFPLGAPGA